MAGLQPGWAARFVNYSAADGLPSNTVFLWIVANIIGLGYGAAAMLDEMDRGEVSREDVLLLDSHICISHSNLEDLLLLTACGAVWWIMLLSRWAMSIILVWEQRIELLGRCPTRAVGESTTLGSKPRASRP